MILEYVQGEQEKICYFILIIGNKMASILWDAQQRIFLA